MSTKWRDCGFALWVVVGASGCADLPQELPPPDAAEDGAAELPEHAALVAEAPDPNSTYIESLRASGTGCPAGSWRGSISPDGLAFTLTFSKYFVQLDTQTTALSMSLNCNVTLGLHTPPGTTYAITQFAYQGYAFVEEGAIAKQKVQYAFQGIGGNLKESIFVMQGPFDQGFLFEDDVETRSRNLDWSPCGRTRSLQLRTVLAAERPDTSVVALANTLAIDGQTKQTTPPRRENQLIVRFKQALCAR